jgi:peptidyl-prolyl cis-trans isomerase C
MALQACHGGAPKGQVVATVNGQEITYQDLSAEARAERVQRADPKAILQKVIARVLFAQDAHNKGMDRYPGYPADIKRLDQTFLAERNVQSQLKPPNTAPSSTELRAFELARPFVFANRMRIELDELHFANNTGVKGLEQMTDLSQVTERLKSLGVPVDRQTRTVDTADLPPPLAQRFASAPEGQLTFLKTPSDTIAMVVKGRSPVSMPQDQADALATRLLAQQGVQQQVAGLLKGLQQRAKITYQKGFAPPAPGAQPAASGTDSASNAAS